jgi:hypothetical protein
MAAAEGPLKSWKRAKPLEMLASHTPGPQGLGGLRFIEHQGPEEMQRFALRGIAHNGQLCRPRQSSAGRFRQGMVEHAPILEGEREIRAELDRLVRSQSVAGSQDLLS